MWPNFLFLTAIVAAVVRTGESLSCYSCSSNEPGCGKELSIRLERWKSCPSTGPGGGENFCVKVVSKESGESVLTRDCLMTLRGNSFHRQKLPTVQRHGYCSPARNDDPSNPYDENLIYCFCNDYNGCNPAAVIKAKFVWTLLLGAVVAVFIRKYV